MGVYSPEICPVFEFLSEIEYAHSHNEVVLVERLSILGQT